MRCPRCETEVATAVASCPRCAAPLLFGEEPPPSALDGELSLDRRGRSRDVAGEALRGARPDRQLGQDPALDRDHDLDGDRGVDGVLEIHLGRAPALRRLAAAVVDAATLALFAGPPLALAFRRLPPGADALALAPAALGLAAALAFAHAVVGHALLGATLGKRLLGLRVAGPDGAPPSFARSAVRALLALAGAAPLGLGPAVGLFTRSGRALHDLAAGTVVVRAP